MKIDKLISESDNSPKQKLTLSPIKSTDYQSIKSVLPPAAPLPIKVSRLGQPRIVSKKKKLYNLPIDKIMLPVKLKKPV